MKSLEWLLKLDDSRRVILSVEASEELNLERDTTVGKVREMIEPKPKTAEMIVKHDDLNMEL